MIDLHTVTIDEVGDLLGVRAYNILRRMGVDTCGDLLTLTLDDLVYYCNTSGHALGLPAYRQIVAATDYLKGLS